MFKVSSSICFLTDSLCQVNQSDIDVKKYCDRMTDTGSKVEGYEILAEDIENVVVARITEIKED